MLTVGNRVNIMRITPAIICEVRDEWEEFGKGASADLFETLVEQYKKDGKQWRSDTGDSGVIIEEKISILEFCMTYGVLLDSGEKNTYTLAELEAVPVENPTKKTVRVS